MTENPNIAHLLQALSGDIAQRESAKHELIAIGAPAIEPLLDILTTQQGKAAIGAAYVLGEIGDERVVPALSEALFASSSILSGAAVEALQKLSPPDLALKFMEAFPQTTIVSQQSILITISELDDPRVIPQLIDQLPQVPSPVLRCAIIKALGELGNATIIPTIEAYADDKDHHVRDWVQTSIALLAQKNASDNRANHND